MREPSLGLWNRGKTLDLGERLGFMLDLAVNERERTPSPRFGRDSFQTRSSFILGACQVLRCETDRVIGGDVIATGSFS